MTGPNNVKLVVYQTDEKVRQLGLRRGDEIVPVGDRLPVNDPSFDDLLSEYLTAGNDWLMELPDSVERVDRLSVGDVDLRPPVAADARVICLGGSFTSHLEEKEWDPLRAPVVWPVPDTSIVGHEDRIRLPDRVLEDTRPAVELGAVIGRGGRYIDETDTFDHIAGYTVVNDVTARTDWPGPMAYKMLDGFNPVGPHVVPEGAVLSPTNLETRIVVDDEVVFEHGTAGIRFSIPFVISYLSSIIPLRAGDIISLGDPGGVERALQPGESVTVSIESVGSLRNEIETYPGEQ